MFLQDFWISSGLGSASYKFPGIWTARINGPCMGINLHCGVCMVSPVSDLLRKSYFCTA